MTEDFIGEITKLAADAAGVPVYHAPSGAAGEKIIYTFTPGAYDGEWEHFTLNLRFISASAKTARERCESVSRVLSAPGDAELWRKDGRQSFAIRKSGGGSGFIGRTGHFFTCASFAVTRRLQGSH